MSRSQNKPLQKAPQESRSSKVEKRFNSQSSLKVLKNKNFKKDSGREDEEEGVEGAEEETGPEVVNKPFVNESETGRNDPCPCGSGKKYKKCCG